MNGRIALLFFFQAEDGIRDIGVTGVQTCALPIWRAELPSALPRSVSLACVKAHHGTGQAQRADAMSAGASLPCMAGSAAGDSAPKDRKSVAEGKSVYLGGRRIIKTKKNKDE